MKLKVATSPSNLFCKPRIQDSDNKFIKCILVPEREIYFAAVLGMAYEVTNYVLLVFVTLLTDVLKLELEKAVMITNIQEGLQSTFFIILACLSDCFLGRSIALVCAALILITGLTLFRKSFIVVSSPDKSNELTWIFFLALVLVTLGQCGYIIYETKWDQETTKKRMKRHQAALSNSKQHQEVPSLCTRVAQYLKNWFLLTFKETNWIRVIGLFVAFFTLTAETTIVKFGRLHILLLIGTFGFCIGKILFYGFEKPQGTSLVQVLHVVCVAGKRLFCHANQHQPYLNNDHVNDNNDEQVNDDHHIQNQTADSDVNEEDHRHLLVPGSNTNVVNDNNQINETQSPFTDSLRCLDKVALYDSSAEMPPEELYKKGKIRTVEEVEKTKRFLRAYLLSSTFMMYDIMTAVGSTFFVMQADKMDNSIMSIKVPIELFMLSSSLVRKIVRVLCEWVVGEPDELDEQPTRTKRRHGFYGAIRVLLGISLSVPCFMIASVIEGKRLKVVNVTKIKAYLLLPQLSLLGAMDGLAVNGMEYFFKKETPEEFELYVEYLTEGAIGLGKLLSVLFLSLVNNLSRTNDEDGWFGHDLNNSKLDKYYKLMTIVGVVCCVFHASLVAYTSGACHQLRSSFIQSSFIA